ncbi:MAG: DNA helicase UvrD [Candidatus Kerfeldbacteria bacterium]|nr:DNA helicase UvrD [Candidatus Kerfeldbacteria bacterium]
MAETIIDLHLHSKYSRAVSRDMNLEEMSRWGQRKGIHVLATADFTHPAWYAELKNKLKLQENGLYTLRSAMEPTQFVLSTELSCIYSQDGKVRRIHILIIFPTLSAVEIFNSALQKEGANLRADGRPILGMSAERIVELAKTASAESIIIPAHIWTPWFSMFGSMSGFDSVAQCFGKQAPHIHAVETGLSSDPAMNWRLSQLDQIQIVSFSDAHSAKKMAREATVLDLTEISYTNIRQSLEHPTAKNHISYTIEFFPEEGKYHFDGHRDCGVRLSPSETKRVKNICPKCKKPLTIGVMHRVDALADRPENYTPTNRPPFKSIVPLQEIIADAFGVGVNSKRVQTEFDTIVEHCAPEFEVLLHTDLEKISSTAQPIVVEGIKRVRAGKLHILPGFDGEFGTVKVFTDAERTAAKIKQKALF